MIAYTIQMGKWRKAQAMCVFLLDVTVKSGSQEAAPTRYMVNSYKYGSPPMTEETYTRLYFELLEESWLNNPEFWHAVVSSEAIAFACYCGAGKFCHRHLLIQFLQKKCMELGIDFAYNGEIE